MKPPVCVVMESTRLPSLVLKLDLLDLIQLRNGLETQCQIKTSITRSFDGSRKNRSSSHSLCIYNHKNYCNRIDFPVHSEGTQETYHLSCRALASVFIFRMSRVINKLSTAYQMDGARVPFPARRFRGIV